MNPTFSTIMGIIGLFIGIVALVLIFVFRAIDEGKRVEAIRAKLHGFDEKGMKLLENSEKILQRMQQFSTAHHIRPELTTYLVSQWEFIVKTFRNRYEKHDMCRRIVSSYLSNNDTILLDSGSSVDLVTYELLSSDLEDMNVYTNNVFAAMHLVGKQKVKLHLLSGIFSDRFAAVYSKEANNRIVDLPINVFILAATAIRFSKGIMVNRADEDNSEFKRTVLRAFTRAGKRSILIIAVDGTKFVEPTEKHQGVLEEKEWGDLIRKYANQIKIVTAPLRRDVEPSLCAQFEQEISKFVESGVYLDTGECR